MPDPDLTNEQARAAQLVADGDFTFPQIAEQIGISRQSLLAWRKRPEFIQRVAEIREDYRQAIRQRGVAILEKRVEAQNDRWRRMQRVIQERAEAPEMENVPGGKTGLMIRRLKMLGTGENATVVEEFEVDTGLLREIREVEKIAAQELGQWTEKVESSGGLKIQVEYVDADAQDPTAPAP